MRSIDGKPNLGTRDNAFPALRDIVHVIEGLQHREDTLIVDHGLVGDVLPHVQEDWHHMFSYHCVTAIAIAINF